MDSLQRRVNHAVKLQRDFWRTKRRRSRRSEEDREHRVAERGDLAEGCECASVSEYERIRDSRGGGWGQDNAAIAAEMKMRSVVSQSKLQHIARAQAEELAVLQDEVERLRLRTFPSFVERTDTVRLPTTLDPVASTVLNGKKQLSPINILSLGLPLNLAQEPLDAAVDAVPGRCTARPYVPRSRIAHRPVRFTRYNRRGALRLWPSLLFVNTNSGVPFRSLCDSMVASIDLLSSSCSTDDAASTTKIIACMSL